MNNVKSAERVLDLLELLSMHERPMRFIEIAAELGYPKSSLHGLLATLVNRSYVLRDHGDRYALVQSFREGFNWVGGFEAVLRRHAIPIMTAARDASGETVFLSVRDENQDARKVHKVVSKHPIRYDAAEEAVPAYASVMGRVLLAHAPAHEVDAYFARVELRPFTDKSLTEEAAIRAVLQDIRERGYGIIEEEYAVGGCGIAAPVRDRSGNVVAVLDIATVVQRYELRKAEMLQCVLEAAAELGAKLGYRLQTNEGEA